MIIRIVAKGFSEWAPSLTKANQAHGCVRYRKVRCNLLVILSQLNALDDFPDHNFINFAVMVIKPVLWRRPALGNHILHIVSGGA